MPAKNKETSVQIRKWIRRVVFATNIVVIGLLFMSLLAWTVSPQKTTFFSYLGLAFPLIVVLNLLYLLLWAILLNWKLALVQLIALLLCWSATSTYFPLHFATKEIPTDCIKILSYNVQSFGWKQGEAARKNPIFEYINKVDADIVCMQEFTAMDDSSGKAGIITQKEVNKLFQKYPYRSVVKVGTLNTSYIYGIACYSKYPIVKVNKIPIYSTYNGSVLYEIKIKGKVITLINNHLESNRITAQDKSLYRQFFKTKDVDMLDAVSSSIQDKLGVAYKVRAMQVDVIAQQAKNQQTDGTIICGDFNDTPISYTYAKLKEGRIDAYAHTGMGQGITYNANKFWFRIDFILHSPNIESYNCTVDKVNYSDHYPVWTYLQLKD